MISRLVLEDMDSIFELGSCLHRDFSKLYTYSSLNEGPNITYVLKMNNTIIGFVHIEDTFDIMSIVDIVIKDDYRNSGNGEKLLNYIFSLYKKRFLLEVSDKNIVAIKFYQKLGFHEINRRKRYYFDGDAIIMERNCSNE